MKKNIAIVITRLDLGGAQKVALYLAEHLNRKKYDVHFIAGSGGYMDEAIQNSKFKIQNLNLWPELIHPIHPIADIIALFKMVSYFKKNKIDIVHTHSSKAGILGRLAAKLAGVPVIIHTIHGFPFHEYQNPAAHAAYLMVEKLFAGITTKFIAVGKDVMGYGLKKGVGREDQYTVIRPGVELGRFKSSKLKAQGFLEKYGLMRGRFTVGMIGNCKPQKNPMEFVRVAKMVLKEKPDTQFIFAGDGPLKQDALEFLRAHKIEDRVKFIGWTDAPETFMKSIDLFLLTSMWEGIPCTLAQAAAAKKPIVASAIDGNMEFMEKSGAGKYLYTPKKPAAAAEKIIEIINRPKSYKIRPEKLLKEFDLKLMVRQHEKLYG